MVAIPLILVGHHPKLLGDPCLSESETARALYTQIVGYIKLRMAQQRSPVNIPIFWLLLNLGYGVVQKRWQKDTYDGSLNVEMMFD